VRTCPRFLTRSTAQQQLLLLKSVLRVSRNLLVLALQMALLLSQPLRLMLLSLRGPAQVRWADSAHRSAEQ
jgi:hypothetical protein